MKIKWPMINPRSDDLSDWIRYATEMNKFATKLQDAYALEKKRLDWILSDNEPYFIDDRGGIRYYIQNRKDLDEAMKR